MGKLLILKLCEVSLSSRYDPQSNIYHTSVSVYSRSLQPKIGKHRTMV